jgi:hypothetical protein
VVIAAASINVSPAEASVNQRLLAGATFSAVDVSKA